MSFFRLAGLGAGGLGGIGGIGGPPKLYASSSPQTVAGKGSSLIMPQFDDDDALFFLPSYVQYIYT